MCWVSVFLNRQLTGCSFRASHRGSKEKKTFFSPFSFFKPGSLCLHFCFFKFPISPDLFPSGFIHDLHLEIISVHENKPSAILGKSRVCMFVCCSQWNSGFSCSNFAVGMTFELKKKKICCFYFKHTHVFICGWATELDSDAELQATAAGRNYVSGRSLAKRLTLAQTKNMHLVSESLHSCAGKKIWLVLEKEHMQPVTRGIKQIFIWLYRPCWNTSVSACCTQETGRSHLRASEE